MKNNTQVQATRFWRRPHVVMLTAASLALAACGSSGGGDASGNAKIGLLIPLTGEYGDFGASWQKAAQMAIDEANAAGALPGGGKLGSVVGDEGTGDAENAIKLARRMIDSQGAAAIVGPTSGPMLALEPIATRSNVPVISSSAGTVALNSVGGEYLFRTVPSDDADRLAVTTFLATQDATKLSMFVENSPSPVSTAAAVKDTFEAKGGTVTTAVRVNPGESSFRTAVGKVLSGDPEWIFCACTQRTGTSILKDLAATGYTGGRIVSPDLATDGAIKAVGAEAMEGTYALVASANTDSVEYQTFDQKYQTEFGEPAGTFAANTYDAVALIVLAIFAADSTDGKEFSPEITDVSTAPGVKVTSIAEGIEALKAGEEIDYDGVSGPIELDKTGTAASSYTILQARDGVYEQALFISAEEIAAAK